eukprot:TRINITY_DN50305_c0_g1_i1.p2 TRINITY_DN50305_c0_g1~~TRINITY_DN50305_c0_g1_i1.p2  ORF type:complete len:118 (-),score=7.95 TRINITY_DN50305_c0_g1_i1:4-357(-)
MKPVDVFPCPETIGECALIWLNSQAGLWGQLQEKQLRVSGKVAIQIGFSHQRKDYEMALPPIAALEIGTSRIRAVVGEQLENGQMMVIGLGECPSRGVRKGEIVHFGNVIACPCTLR